MLHVTINTSTLGNYSWFRRPHQMGSRTIPINLFQHLNSLATTKRKNTKPQKKSVSKQPSTPSATVLDSPRTQNDNPEQEDPPILVKSLCLTQPHLARLETTQNHSTPPSHNTSQSPANHKMKRHLAPKPWKTYFRD